jgi:2-keto-4-pentenoate hydratase/2-oxohepta-3-ene-1,7-dioic acid hydratase in catechol pathway
MRLASFEVEGRSSYGLVTRGGVVDAGVRLGSRHPSLSSLLDADGWSALAALVSTPPDHDERSVRWLPPILQPGKVFCVLLNYEASRLAQGRPKLQYPHIVTRFGDTHVGSGSPILKPAGTEEFDYEGEVAVVIGRGGRYIPRAHAWSHVLGLAAYNDATPRDWMRHSRQFTAAKSFPSTAGFGPWITTLDEIGDLDAVTLQTRLNGDVVQSGSLGDLSHPVPELVEYVSSFTELRPGDVIATGTPAGSGYKRMPPRFLRSGDVVEVDVGGVGVLTNPVEAELVTVHA